MILAECTPDEAAQYKGKALFLPKQGTKKEQVRLNVLVKSLDEANGMINGAVQCVTVCQPVTSVPAGFPSGVSIFEYIDSLEDFSPVSGVTYLLRQPKGFSNVQEMARICKSNPQVRLVGGSILALPALGLRVGRTDRTRKGKILFQDKYDIFNDLVLSDISATLVVEDGRTASISAKVGSKSGKASTSTRSSGKARLELGKVAF